MNVCWDAEAALRAARALFYAAIEDSWRATRSGDTITVGLRTRLRLCLAATHAARTSAHIVRCTGSAADWRSTTTHPLQRRFRGATTATAPMQVSPAVWETTGRILLCPAASSFTERFRTESGSGTRFRCSRVVRRTP
ncbi:hypothetical protein [Streptomyces sp. NPDC002324]